MLLFGELVGQATLVSDSPLISNVIYQIEVANGMWRRGCEMFMGRDERLPNDSLGQLKIAGESGGRCEC